MKLEKIRQQIDLCDQKLLKILSRRLNLAKKAGKIKEKMNIKLTDSKREKEIIEKIISEAKENSLSFIFVVKIFREIIKESKKIQREGL